MNMKLKNSPFKSFVTATIGIPKHISFLKKDIKISYLAEVLLIKHSKPVKITVLQ